jgi:hypothetical protein
VLLDLGLPGIDGFEAAAHAGIPFNQLVDRLVKRAHKRGAA